MKRELRRASERFRSNDYFYFYSRGKLALDPAYPATLESLRQSRLPLMDIGCGIGLLGACLRELGHTAPIVGVDLDAKKIATAQELFARDGMEFHARDAREFPPHQGDVVMMDVLHYFTDEDQRKLLERVAASVAPGGTAYIRTTVNEPGWRFTMTRLEEHFVHRIGWIPSYGSNFATMEEVEGPLRAAGLEGKSRPMWGWTPFNSYLFVFRRPGA